MVKMKCDCCGKELVNEPLYQIDLNHTYIDIRNGLLGDGQTKKTYCIKCEASRLAVIDNILDIPVSKMYEEVIPFLYRMRCPKVKDDE